MTRFTAVLLVIVTLTTPIARADDIRDSYLLIFSRHGVRSATEVPSAMAPWAAEPWPAWGVAAGILTPHGAAVAMRLGEFYRASATANGIVAPSGCSDAAHVFVTADVKQRTIATAQALADGMFPGCGLIAHHAAVGPDPLYHAVEAHVGTPDRALELAAIRGRFGHDLTALRRAYATEFTIIERATRVPFVSGPLTVAPGSGRSPVKIKGPFGRAATIAELFELEYANGLPASQVGWGRVSLNDIIAAGRLRTLLYDMLERTRYPAAVEASNLLSHLTASLDQAARGTAVEGAIDPPKTRVAIVVGHDSNVAALGGLLDLTWSLPTYQPNDPAPTGALMFRLGRRASDGAAVVRLAYVAASLGQMRDGTVFSLVRPPRVAPVFIPGCSEAGTGYPCPLARFDALVKASIDRHFVAP